MTDALRSAIVAGGYPALAAIILAENVFPPIPSEVILPLAGFYVGTGELVFVPAVLAATVGSVLGALLIYALGRYGGRSLLLRHGRLLRLRERDIDRAEAWFEERGAWVVLIGRLIPGARSVVSVPAGLAQMPLFRFTSLTALGSLIWNSVLIAAGWALGSNYGRIGELLGPTSTVITVGLLLAAAGAAVWWWRRSPGESRTGRGGPSGEEARDH